MILSLLVPCSHHLSASFQAAAKMVIGNKPACASPACALSTGTGSGHRALFFRQMGLEGVWVLLAGAGHSPG